MSQQDDESLSRPTSAPRGRRGVVSRVVDGAPTARPKRAKPPRPSTGRPRGRPTKGLLTVACPTCLSGVNVSCVTSTGKKLAAGHKKRRELAGLDPREKWKPVPQTGEE